MKKTIFLVLSALLLLLLGCRTELDPILEQTTDPPAFTIIHNNAGLLENNPLLSGKISKAGALSKSFSSKSSLDDYTVYPDRVTYVSREGSGRESYAFYIERKGAKSDYIVENLVFSRNKTDQEYSVFQVTYFLPKGIGTDSKDIRVEKMEKLSSTDFSSIVPKNNTASKGGGGCTVEFIIEETKHACYSGKDYGAEAVSKCDGKGSLPYSTYAVKILSYGCNDLPSGGGPSSQDGGNSNSGSSNPGSGINLPADMGISLPPSCQTADCGETIVANDINVLLDKRLNYENLLWLHQNPQQADAIYQGLQNNTQPFIKEFYIWGVGFLSEGNAYADLEAMKDFTFSFRQNNPNVTWTEFWYNKYSSQPNSSFDPNDNLAGNYDETIYADFDFENQQTQWPTINPVISASNFVGWGAPGIKRDCMSYCKAQISKNGYKISNYYDVDSNGNKQTFQIYTEQGGVNQNDLYKGVSYLKYALSKGIPVVVGVDTETGNPHGNLDNTTDHFIVIVGMGTDSKGRYFRFYDNASGDVNQGTHPDNKLYIKYPEKIFTGQTQCVAYRAGTDYNYILTMIRKSK